MPHYQPSHTIIDIAVQDRVFHDTRVRQRARYISLTQTHAADGSNIVQIELEVTMYAAVGEEFGQALIASGFMPRKVLLVADNETIVHRETGKILAILTGLNQAQRDEKLAELAEVPTIYQGDYFEQLRKTGFVMDPLIEQHIRAADLLMNKFA